MIAKWPGSCLCGSRFNAGAEIHWDGSVRRATLCPSCASPKAKKGTQYSVPGNSEIGIRFDRHPTTNEVVLVAFTESTSWRALEVYRKKDGRWGLSQTGKEMVWSGPISHERIEAWREALGEQP